MNTHDSVVRLPGQFAQLQPFVGRWALADLADRAEIRAAATEDERRTFHAALKASIGPLLDYLDSRPIDALDAAESALLNLALTYVHVALGLEIQGEAEAAHRRMRDNMKIVPGGLQAPIALSTAPADAAPNTGPTIGIQL